MAANEAISKPESNPKYRLHPTQLDKKARAQHIVDVLLEYNRGIIENNPAGANRKFDKLTLSPFVFLRGTADLMYRDLVGTDANMSTVLCMGDVHLENFGVMETEDGMLIWGLNDFDEVAFAPFSWDVKRGATSVVLAARERDFSTKQCLRLAKSFAAAYLDTIRKSIDSDIEARPGFTRERGPKLIRKKIKKAKSVKSEEWLAEEYLDEATGGFAKTDEIEPVSDRVGEFQKAVDAYLPSLAGLYKNPPKNIKVLDVAIKTGSGTGSIGLWRYYALVEAERTNQMERLILELKNERHSVLKPYVGNGPLLFPSEGARVAFGEDVQLPNANPYYGYTRLDGNSYLVRERSPHKARIKLDKLTKFKDFKRYTEACGNALAYAHARSDRALGADREFAERRILQSVNPDTFADDISHFSVRMADQVTEDWKSFLAAYQTGKFTFSAKKRAGGNR